MNTKEYFERIELKEIQAFVEEQTAESLFFEFKTANYPNLNGITDDKKNFSKCLSGFANSSGGILIWGISAKEKKNRPDVANELKPINDLIGFETYLKKNEGNAVIPLIDGVEYRRVLNDDNNGYLLVYIPQSDRAPHMALFADKRYYKRSGDSFYMSEHFDIMDMLNRKITPKLSVELINEKVLFKKGVYGEYEAYDGMLCIKNVGQTSAKHIVLSIIVKRPFHISQYGLDGNYNKGMKSMTIKSTLTKYFGGSELVLHPETHHEVDRITLNEISENNGKLCDLIIEYEVIAEDMKLTKGKIIRKKEELFSKTSAK